MNHQYASWEDAWNEETQQYEFPWGNVNANDYNFEGLHDPHNHHPQNPEVPEDWMGGPLVPGYWGGQNLWFFRFRINYSLVRASWPIKLGETVVRYKINLSLTSSP